ncbi:MAG: PQQ-like beta-propeller repeat protein [Chloroflexi bacterium]|nr:PQQ-like beta-propeller repeat protein [Chloroflexota bacterium]
MNSGENDRKVNNVLFRLLIIFVLFLVTSIVTYAQSLAEQGAGLLDGVEGSTAVTDWSTSWSMAGANPERASWTAEEVRGNLKPIWHKPFEPYISQKVQIIAANNLLYIATARGLYALDAANGNTEWIYATEFPLGHSPTIHNDVAYVGGFDHKIHAVNALTGQGIWTFKAEAGFHTNPLIAEGKLYAGNRDGYFYAIHIEGTNSGQLAWKYKTGGPILYSAAYKDGVVFFAANDSRAYALNAATGALVWKSAKLPGAGFNSYWPVVYQDRVIFAGSNNYRFTSDPGIGSLASNERDDIYGSDPRGTPVGSVGTGAGDWAAGTPTINATAVYQYFNAKPWRRTVFVLDRFTGQEQETAPVLWASNDGSGTRYPPVIGADGVLYQQNSYLADDFIPGGQVSGWQPGNNYITIISSDWGAVDEPHAAAGGGNLVYWNLCCDREAGAFDVTLPNTVALDRWNSGGKITGSFDNNREWRYFSYNLESIIPGYNLRFYNPMSDHWRPQGSFRGPDGGISGVYGFHGDVNPLIPYQGKVYMHRSNAVIAFADTDDSPTALPLATAVSANDANITPLSENEIRARLESEVQKMLDAGHLRPGYMSHGIFDLRGQSSCGDDLSDYWSSPTDTIVTLINALPHLPPAMQQEVKTYIQNEFNNHLPYDINHVGWLDGASREIFDLPPEVTADLVNNDAEKQNYTFKNDGGWDDVGVWGRSPYVFYALWKYAELFGDAETLYAESEDDLATVTKLPSNTLLLNMPLVHNAYIAGYYGFLELEKLAGQPESTDIKNELNRLIALRVNNFARESAYAGQESYCNTLNVASNFMYLTPELAEHLRADALGAVADAVNYYDEIAPYWFVAFAAEGYAEDPKATLYDAHGIFMARAWILQESGDDLAGYLDVPAFDRGDLFYIDKLAALLGDPEPGFGMSVESNVIVMEPGETKGKAIEISHTGGFSQTVTLEATSPSPSLLVDIDTTSVPAPGGQVLLTVTDLHMPPLMPGQWYTIPVVATADSIIRTVNVDVLIGGARSYLPLASKN